MERNLERKERKERKRNVIIKGLEVKEGKGEGAVEEMLRDIGAKVKIEEVRKLRGGIEGRGK